VFQRWVALQFVMSKVLPPDARAARIKEIETKPKKKSMLGGIVGIDDFATATALPPRTPIHFVAQGMLVGWCLDATS
jgi:hypothetical protein